MRRVAPFFFALALLACAAGPDVREIEALGQRGEAGELLELLKDERSWVREEAARVIGARRMASARGPLLSRARADGERRYVRAAAVRALGLIGNAADRTPLEALAKTPGAAPELKVALVSALCRLAPKESTYDVLALLAADEDLLVAASASTEVDRKCGR